MVAIIGGRQVRVHLGRLRLIRVGREEVQRLRSRTYGS